MKLHLPKLKFPHITKHLLIIAGIGLVVAIVLVGAAEAAHQKHVTDATNAHNAAVARHHDKDQAQTITDLQASIKAQNATFTAVCTYVKQVSLKNKTVTVPNSCLSVI